MSHFQYTMRESTPFAWFISLHCVDKIILILISVLMLSPFGWVVILNFSGHYFAEFGIMIIWFMLILRKSVVIKELRHTILSAYGIAITALLLFLLFFGTLYHGNIIAAYGDFRASFVFVISFLYFYLCKRNFHQRAFLLYILSFFSLILFIVALFFIPESQRLSAKFFYPTMAIPLMMYLASYRNWPIQLFIAVPICGFVSFTSFYRLNWIVFGFGVAVFSGLFIFQAFRQGLYNRKIFQGISAIILLGIAALYAIQNVEYLIGYLSSSESRYIQSIVKLQHLIDYFEGVALQEGDDLRAFFHVFILQNWHQLLFPTGLGHEPLIGNVHSVFSRNISGANTIDSTCLFLAIHFGLIFSFIIIGHLVAFFIRRVVKSQSYLDVMHVMASVLILLFYALVTGIYFSEICSAFFTGSYLGVILNTHFGRLEFDMNRKIISLR